MNFTKTLEMGSALGVIAAVMAATGAWAQDGSEQTTVEEIVVTARRTTENVQEVPLTVNVVTAQRLENAGVTNTAQVRQLVSNFYWADNGGGTTENSMTMRGIGANVSRQGFESGIGVYMDEVYISDTTGFNMALLDIDRIEVLKGPQGTLFGRNTTAGAIAIYSRRPSVDDQYVEAAARLGNYELKEVRAVANYPISDRMALKVSGIYRDRGGYQKNVVTGKNDANTENFWGGRAQLLVTPNEDIDLLFTADYFKNDDKQNVFSCWGPSACSFNPTFASVFDDRVGDDNSYSDRTLWSTALNAKWRFGEGWEATSITAYQSREYHNDQDQDFVPGDYIRSGFHEPVSRQFSQELRLASPREARLRGVGGVFYSYEDREVTIPGLFKSPLLMNLGAPAGIDANLHTTSKAQTTSAAVFGQATYDLTPTLVAELGLRYTHDAKDFEYQQTLNAAALAGLSLAIRQQLNLVARGPVYGSESFGKATGLASISWRPTEDFNAYLRWAQGYKSGGFQSTTLAAASQCQTSAGVNVACSNAQAVTLPVDTRPEVPFDPEELDSFEAGLKTQWFDDRLRLNFAAFLMNYSDIQVQITDPVNRTKFVTNGGAAKSRGVELEASIAPFRGLTIDGGVGMQHAKYVSNKVINGVAVTSFQGRRLQNAPRTTANLSVTYRWDAMEGWEALASVSGFYRSDIFVDANNSFKSPMVTTVGGRIGIERDGGRWGVYLWGENLSNARRITNAANGKGGLSTRNHFLTQPRTFGIELKGKF